MDLEIIYKVHLKSISKIKNNANYNVISPFRSILCRISRRNRKSILSCGTTVHDTLRVTYSNDVVYNFHHIICK